MRRQLFSVVFLGAIALLAGSVAFGLASVEPVLDEDWVSGNAEAERIQSGGCGPFAWKLDEWGKNGAIMNGTYDTEVEYPAGSGITNKISIANDTGKSFSWSSDWPVCAVIVKAGTSANVYSYNPSVLSDDGLVAPENKDVSHVTFVFGPPPQNDDDPCFENDTAWAAGDRYMVRGNWATYTPYGGGNETVSIYAGQSKLAGTAKFTPLGDQVEIEISLDNGFFFNNKPDEEEDDNIAVQDYAVAPKGNPAPGRFDWKAFAPVGSTSYTITVPYNGFYGIHLNVAKEMSCPVEP